jgi:hypothetical protein
VLRTKLKDVVGVKAKTALEKELGFALPPKEAQQLGEILGPAFGDNQFDNIVKFMSGRTPSECDETKRGLPGSEKCIALVYEGVSAVNKFATCRAR